MMPSLPPLCLSQRTIHSQHQKADNTSMRRIFVSGASGIVGYGILRSLRRSADKLLLVGSSIFEDSVAPGFCDIFETAVPTADPSYLDWLDSVLEKHRIELLIPGIEPDLYKWSDNADRIETFDRRIVLNNLDLISLCRDKWLFYLEMRRLNLATAIPSSLHSNFKNLEKEFGLPFLLKPRCSFGSKGIVKIQNEETFSQYQAKIGSDLMVQPFIGSENEEYSSAVFGDGNGSFSTHITLRRKLSFLGFTEKAEVVDDKNVLDAMTELCGHFSPLGPTNFQFRFHQGQIKLLEINPRISSSTSIRTGFGYNEPAMAVDYFLNARLPVQPHIRKGRAVRYWEDYLFTIQEAQTATVAC